MTWIDGRLAEKQAIAAREMRIHSAGSQIQGELWKEIIAQLEEAKKKQFGKITVLNGQVLLPVDVPPGQHSSEPRKLSVQLKKDHSAIVAEITGGGLTLPLDTDGDRVFLKFEDKTLTIPNAATLILDRFLFPELKRLDVKSITAWKGL